MLISFESHIVDEVVSRFDGKYTPDQIRDVYRASIGYINNLLKYTDNVSVRIPHVGEVVCNRNQMYARTKHIERLRMKGYGSHDLDVEYDALVKKISDADEYKSTHDVKRGTPLFKHYARMMRLDRLGYSFRELQKIQDVEFENNF